MAELLEAKDNVVVDDYHQDGPQAQAIASVIPYYPFHGKISVHFKNNFKLIINISSFLYVKRSGSIL